MIRHNLRYKVLALCIALALQMMYGRAEEKPVSSALIRTHVRADDEPAGLKAMLPFVAVAVQGPQSVVEHILANPDAAEDAVTAVVNLKGLGPGSHSLPVTITTRKPLEVLPGDAPTASVKIEEIIESPRPVVVVPQGSLTSSYRWESTTVQPQFATVQGPRSAVDQVARLEARVPAGPGAADVERSVRVQAVDSRDEPVSTVSILPEHVRVRVRVSRVLRFNTVPVAVQTSGMPAPGFRIARVIVEPLTVTISSTGKTVDDVQAITTDLFSVEGASTALVRELALKPPQGVEVVGVPSVRVKVFLASDTVTPE